MMSSTIYGAGTAILLGAMLTPVVFPEKPFLVVDDFSIESGIVSATRTINGPDVYADWSVTIVPAGESAPICRTIHGQSLHEGWSQYSQHEARAQDFTLDLWVGDYGCSSRLASGDYYQFVTWTPRDGRPPVAMQYEFTVD